MNCIFYVWVHVDKAFVSINGDEWLSVTRLPLPDQYFLVAQVLDEHRHRSLSTECIASLYGFDPDNIEAFGCPIPVEQVR